MRAPSAPLLDSFDRANGGLGSAWGNIWNGDVVSNISSNQAVTATDGFGTSSYFKTLVPSPDQEASALVTMGAMDAHILARLDPATVNTNNPTYYELACPGVFSTGSGLALHKWVAGVDTQLLADTGPAGFDAIMIQCVGRVITGSYRKNGVWIVGLQIEDASIPATAGGYIGFEQVDTAASGHTGKFDNFSGGAVSLVEDFLSNAGAVAAGYARTQQTKQVFNGKSYVSEFLSTYTKQLTPSQGTRYVWTGGVGSSFVSQAAADTAALSSLNANRRHRWAGSPGATSGTLVVSGTADSA